MHVACFQQDLTKMVVCRKVVVLSHVCVYLQSHVDKSMVFYLCTLFSKLLDSLYVLHLHIRGFMDI